MKKEFMLYIRNAGDAEADLKHDEHLAFIKMRIEVRPVRMKEEQTNFVYPSH